MPVLGRKYARTVIAKSSSEPNAHKRDDSKQKECKRRLLKMFDSIFLLQKVPLNCFLEFLKLYVSDNCAMVVREFALQKYRVYLSQTQVAINPPCDVDLEKINAAYGSSTPQSLLQLLGDLRLIFRNKDELDEISCDLDDNEYCCLDRGSASTFLTRFLLSSSIEQSSAGRLLRLSQGFVYNETVTDAGTDTDGQSANLNAEERIGRIESVVGETEKIILSIKSSFDKNVRCQLDESKLSQNHFPLSNHSDRSLSNCVNSCKVAIGDIQEKIKIIDRSMIHHTVQDIRVRLYVSE